MIENKELDRLLERLESAENVCRMLYQNSGMHPSAIGKCTECDKEMTRGRGMVCDKCIAKALIAWKEQGGE